MSSDKVSPREFQRLKDTVRILQARIDHLLERITELEKKAEDGE